VSPLASWFPDDRGLAQFRRRSLGRAARVVPPRDRAWRAVAPDFTECVAMAGGGVPFQLVAERHVDRSGDPRRLPAALAAGQTVYLPQVHQVLPRLMRLMVALRVAFFGPGRDEASFLFIVDGTGRPGMGLHHDGEVDAFWLQLEGRRTVTVGPRVAPGTPEDLDERRAQGGRRAGWHTFDLAPGTLFHVPARTPHAVVCRGRSLAVTLTWARARRARAGRADRGLLRWDVVSGFADPIPPASPTVLWTQVPTLVEAEERDALLRVWTPEGAGPRLARRARAAGARLRMMPRLSRALARRAGLAPLIEAGILGSRDLPRRIRPDAPAALDGWRFA
jgi:mannose-6-phosphate isomerase-like protein (cupin superfamily)